MINFLKKQKGVAVLMVVVIMAAAVLLMAMGATWLGLGELETGYTSQKSKEAQAIADGCLEEALRRLKLDNNYLGGNLDLTTGNCIISVAGAGSDKTVTAASSVNEYHKIIAASITINFNNIIINSWQEIEN